MRKTRGLNDFRIYAKRNALLWLLGNTPLSKPSTDLRNFQRMGETCMKNVSFTCTNYLGDTA